MLELPIRLLSLQHVAREIFKKDKHPDSMSCTVFVDRVLLIWCSDNYIRTTTLGSNNVPIVQSSPGYNKSTIVNTPNQWSLTAIKA
jgi:hypothetical protein